MRKYVLNGQILSAIMSGWSSYKTTKTGPNDWRVVATWIAWGLTLAVAIGTVHIQSKELRD